MPALAALLAWLMLMHVDALPLPQAARSAKTTHTLFGCLETTARGRSASSSGWSTAAIRVSSRSCSASACCCMRPLQASLAAVALLGAGLGGMFALTLVLTLDHADDHALAAHLVAFVQGVDFVVAAIAPMIAGIVRDVSGNFTLSWTMLAVSVAAMIGLNFVFAPRGYARAMVVPQDFNTRHDTRSTHRSRSVICQPDTGGSNGLS